MNKPSENITSNNDINLKDQEVSFILFFFFFFLLEN